jgi:hypothetical protein
LIYPNTHLSIGAIFVPLNQKKMENTNKIALVTGGSRGLGKDMALKLAEKGINVILTYNNKADDAENVVSQIQQSGQKAATLQLNTGDIKSFGAFIENLKGIWYRSFRLPDQQCGLWTSRAFRRNYRRSV